MCVCREADFSLRPEVVMWFSSVNLIDFHQQFQRFTVNFNVSVLNLIDFSQQFQRFQREFDF